MGEQEGYKPSDKEVQAADEPMTHEQIVGAVEGFEARREQYAKDKSIVDARERADKEYEAMRERVAKYEAEEFVEPNMLTTAEEREQLAKRVEGTGGDWRSRNGIMMSATSVAADIRAGNRERYKRVHEGEED